MMFLRIFFSVCIFLFPSLVFATQVREVKSKSGITAWLVEEHSQPLVSVYIAFKDSGVAYDAAGKEGRASLASSMLMEGAGDMDFEAFARSLEDNAIKLDFAVDEDNFYARLQTISEYKENAFAHLSLALLKSRFDEEALARVKRQTIFAIKQQQGKPAYRLDKAWGEQVFPNHPYGKDGLGTEKTVSGLSKPDLLNFVKNYLTRENIIVSVAGDVTPDELAELLDKNLGGLPEKYKADVKISDISMPKVAKQAVVEQDIPQTIIRFGMEGVKRNDPDYMPAYVLNHLLGGGGLNSKLNKEIREKRGLTYSASSSLASMRHADIFSGELATRNEKAGEAVSVLKQTLKEVSEKGASEDELADSKRFLMGSFVVRMSNNGAIVNFLTMMQLHNLGIDYINKRNDLIENVTMEQIRKVANRLLQLDKMQIIMLGKPILGGAGKE